MSMDPEYDRRAPLDHPNGQGVQPLDATPDGVELPRTAEPPLAVAFGAIPAAEPIVATPIKRARRRPMWLVPAAIAAVGLIASGGLGYLFYSTNSKLDATRQHLAATQTTLDSTKLELTNLQTDAANKKAVADYVSMYTVDAGR